MQTDQEEGPLCGRARILTSCIMRITKARVSRSQIGLRRFLSKRDELAGMELEEGKDRPPEKTGASIREDNQAKYESGRSPWIISTGVLPHHVAYGSRTTRLRAVIGVTSVLSVLLLASPVPFTYLSRQLCSAEFSFGGAPVWSF